MSTSSSSLGLVFAVAGGIVVVVDAVVVVAVGVVLFLLGPKPEKKEKSRVFKKSFSGLVGDFNLLCCCRSHLIH